MTRRSLFVLAGLAWLLLASRSDAADTMLNLKKQGMMVLTPPGLGAREIKAVQMLLDEVEKRTLVRWTWTDTWPKDNAVLVIGPADGVRQLLKPRGIQLPEDPTRGAPEGYQIGVARGEKAPVIWVAGNDARGVLFGVGRLLRELRMDRRSISLPANFQEASAPRTPLRGHQLGYRPKTNSYDGWTVALWEQYIRDLAVFGCNAIELIPPRSDDLRDSPHFPLPPARMMAEMSRLADEYGLDVWIWYPAMDENYKDPRTVEFALNEWGNVFQKLPRVDAVFVPGGDPGHTEPDVLFALLEKQTANLRKYHPEAKMWVSPQGFEREKLDRFLQLLAKEPPWLTGVVHGPQVRLDLPAFRAAVPRGYPIRDYPDITHSRHCQYPVPDWDVAFAITLGREGSNPRPTQMATIYRHSRPHTAGFITYSEGCHDDVNKCIWSALGWDERQDVRDVLRQYSRYYIGPAFEDWLADGLLSLERNWVGPARNNAGIDDTLKHFQAMEDLVGPPVKLNWRWQQALYRAYYDAYVRARLRHELALQEQAMDRVQRASTLGAIRAMAEAEALLDRATTEPVAAGLRARVFELAEALFQSIRAQLSVKKYQAIAPERGANLDSIDWPLTDAGWLKAQFAAIRKLKTEPEQMEQIAALVQRDDPGLGGFYDDLGDPQRQPHLVRGEGFAKDPAFYASPLVGFSFRGPGPEPSRPRAWWHHAESLYDTPLVLRYTGLEADAHYRVRVVYAQERREPTKIRLVANERFEVHDYLAKPFEFLEFGIPAEATVGGELKLSWTKEPGDGGHGRGCQVAEVWLRKNGKAK
jgi:hypothetical protein